MMSVSRRAFLRSTAASLAVMAASVPMSSSPRGALAGQALAQKGTARLREFILLCDTPIDVPDPNAAGIRITHPGVIKVLDVASGKDFEIDLPFFGHTVTQNPARPEQIVTFEKWGKRGALVDLKQRRVLALTEADAGRTFFGHAIFNTDASVLITTEDDYNNPDGQVVLRDASTLKVIQKMPSYGVSPHECRTPDHGKTVVVINAGDAHHPPTLAWIDLASGRLEHQAVVERPSPAPVGYSHFDISYDNWICAGGFRHAAPGGHDESPLDLVFFVSPDGNVLRPSFPTKWVDRTQDEALSIAFLGRSGLVGVTVPSLDRIMVLDYRTQTLVDTIQLKKPRGLLPSLGAADKDHGMLASCPDQEGLVSIVTAPGSAPTVHVLNAQFGGRGSHLTRLYM